MPSTSVLRPVAQPRAKIIGFALAFNKKKGLFKFAHLKEADVAQCLLSSRRCLSEDIQADLVHLISKGPGWASATEQNNYSQLLPVCPAVFPLLLPHPPTPLSPHTCPILTEKNNLRDIQFGFFFIVSDHWVKLI